MSGVWSESKKRTVKLPEDDPETFRLYIDLLYTDQISVITNKRSEVNDDTGGDEQNALTKLYVLAEKLQDVDTKNKTLAALLASSTEVHSDNIAYIPEPDSIKIIYDGTPTGSLLRRPVVDLYTAKATESWVATETTFPDEFVRELLISVMKKRAPVPNIVDPQDITPYLEDKNAQGFW